MELRWFASLAIAGGMLGSFYLGRNGLDWVSMLWLVACAFLGLGTLLTWRNRRHQTAQQWHRQVQQNAQLRGLLENTSDAVVILDEQFRFQYLNPQHEVLTGQPREYFQGKLVWAVWPETEQQAYGENYRQTLASGQTTRFLAFLAPIQKWTETTCYRIPGGICVVMSDVTRRVETRLALEAANTRLREAHRIALLGEWAYDVPTDTVTWSPEVYHMLGLPLDESRDSQERMREIYLNPEEAKFRLQEAVRTRQSFAYDAQVRRGDGTTGWVRVHGRVEEREGQPVKFYGTVQDITERKHWTEHLAHLVEEKNVLLAEIHHRVKNNLAIVAGLLQLQLRQTTDLEARDALRQSEARIQAMALLHQTLYQEEQFALVNFTTYLHKLVAFHQQLDLQAGRQLRVQIQAPDVWLESAQAIPAGLIVSELLTNSLKHAWNHRDHCCIDLTLYVQTHDLHLIYTDDGPGFPADATHGLGLTLIAGLTQQLDGEVVVPKARSSRYAFRWPVVARVDRAKAVPEPT